MWEVGEKGVEISVLLLIDDRKVRIKLNGQKREGRNLSKQEKEEHFLLAPNVKICS